MPTQIDTETVQAPTPQSSKKRKVAIDASEPFKKKRKQQKSDDGHLISQETEASKKEKKAKKRQEKKDRTAKAVVEDPDTQDIELPDATTEPVSTDPDKVDENDPTTNGFDADEIVDEIAEVDESLFQSEDPSCFYEKRLSLQLPIPAISLASTTSSLLSLHLAPLLLTYFAPAEGIVLSFSDPVLSASPRFGVNLSLQPPRSGEIARNPTDETFAKCADMFGVCWVWLTATFLVFRPTPGDEMKGWTNVTSEGFIGLVSYNYFQTAVGKSRIPKSWTWTGPTRQTRKKKARTGRLRDEDGVDGSQEDVADSQEPSLGNDMTEGGSGSFVDVDSNKIPATQVFKVVDVEMVPGHGRDRWTLQIDGSLLPKDEEAAALAEERQRFEQVQDRNRSRSKTTGLDAGNVPLMSGAVSFSVDVSPS